MSSDVPQSLAARADSHLDSQLTVTVHLTPGSHCHDLTDTDGATNKKVHRRALSVPRLRPPTSNDLSVVVQLVEAARKARDGDREATRAHIAEAVALLDRSPTRDRSGTAVLSATQTRISRGGLPTWQTSRVFAHIEANLSRRIPVKELARLLGLSASHFCRAFKCTFGVAPRDYVLRRRVEVAQGLMLTTTGPLSDIAVSCGMCDQSHFTRSFHRIVGETPNTWRRARRGVLNVD